jgi:hypothetical protein
VAARALVGRKGIREMRGKREIDYIHIVLPRHEIIIAEGVRTESCYLGPVTLGHARGMDRLRLQALFPRLRAAGDGAGYGPMARPVLRVQKARRVLQAHGEASLVPG